LVAGAYISGVHLSGNATWYQSGSANMTVSGDFVTSYTFSNSIYGVYLSGNPTWNQECTIIANIASTGGDSSDYGVYFGGAATWNQYGNVMVTADLSAVYFQDCGTWNQYGTSNIPPSAIHRSSNCSIVNVPFCTLLQQKN